MTGNEPGRDRHRDDPALDALLKTATAPAAGEALHAAILADFDAVQKARAKRGAWRDFVDGVDGVLAPFGVAGGDRRLKRIASGGVLAGLTAVGFSLGAGLAPTSAALARGDETDVWAYAVDAAFGETGETDWWVAE